MKLAPVFTRARVVSLLVAAAVLLPISVSAGGGIEFRSACADGACCVEISSICLGSDGFEGLVDYYNSRSGSCYSPYGLAAGTSQSR